VTLLGLLAGFVLWPHGRAEALTSGARAFSTQEERALRAGELVTRPSEVVRGESRLMGGLSWQLVSASPERVLRAINDVRTYPRFLPAVEEARLIDQHGNEQRLFIRHRLGFVNVGYFVLATPDVADSRMRFRLDRSRPSSIRDAFGELRVTPYPDGRSVVSLAILADVGEGLVAGLVRSNVHEWMLRVPAQLKKYVEKVAHEPQRNAVEAIEAPAAAAQSGRPG
jgi:Polyketide cyclase / dehydrase and lipid transport